MNQAIAGVSPPQNHETTIMVIWPSVASTGIGRALGGLFMSRAGIGNILTLGNIAALATAPLGILLYFATKRSRYRLTNRRLMVERMPYAKLERSVALDNFDAVEAVIQSGQEWYNAGDLIFRNGKLETFRLPGVPRPETFRRTCLEARAAYVGVQKFAAASA